MMPCSNCENSGEFAGLKVAVLAAGCGSAEPGGAERFYLGLLNGLKEIGCRAELIPVPADEPDFNTIEKNYAYCRDLDVSGFDVVISTKAPTFAVKHPNHVMYLVHTLRVFDDMFDTAFPWKSAEHYIQRQALHTWDIEALSNVKARFAIGHEVARRLYRWRGIRADVIHPPLAVSGFKQGPQGNYFYLPGRLHPWKRVDLVIKAVRQSSLPLRLIISGKGEAEQDLKNLAGGDPRIEFLGRVDDSQLIDLYANALAVPFTPVREDYGYVTLEAFASGKPVLTCTDSGEPTQFVRHKETGLICSPTVDDVQKGLEWLFQNPERALDMGAAGRKLLAELSWAKTAEQLVRAAIAPANTEIIPFNNVSVIDMQPIDPPVGGGRLRLLGLYHDLGERITCRYVGTYDWPGEKFRQHRLSDSLEEINVPLSDKHHAAARELSLKANGKTVIDLAFSTMATLSPEYLEKVKESFCQADIVVFSHPWVYPLVSEILSPNQLVVYDSHNVEGFLRAQLLDESNPAEAALLRQVVEDEYRLGLRADLIFACSQEDANRFERIYGFEANQIRVVPNGVMAFSIKPPSTKDRAEARRKLNLPKESFTALFIGSPYGPNREAASFISNELAGLLPDVTFVIAGGVGEGMAPAGSNVVITGAVSEEDKRMLLQGADIAVNPMFSGSGTNIKMFDFMAAGLPVVTTETGARGIESGGRRAFITVASGARPFAKAIRELKENTALLQRMGAEARLCVEDGYAWERISRLTGRLLTSRRALIGQKKPFFSVIIPTFERHGQLANVIKCLQDQVERDFEVIIIDQSEQVWSESSGEYGFPVIYYHSPVKGAVRARNTGALFAQGDVIAFTDDDCIPDRFWLLNARKYFEQPGVVGVEGMITSDHPDDPDWRPVTNVGFEGIGFMTANLMVRNSVFQRSGGFDLQFDCPHFREDTDFGWRLQGVGLVPYAKDVKIFHPAQPRVDERESAVSRARYFVKDVFLYKKHPERYRELFFKEVQYEVTPGFLENLVRGFEIEGLDMPRWMRSCVKKDTKGRE